MKLNHFGFDVLRMTKYHRQFTRDIIIGHDLLYKIKKKFFFSLENFQNVMNTVLVHTSACTVFTVLLFKLALFV